MRRRSPCQAPTAPDGTSCNTIGGQRGLEHAADRIRTLARVGCDRRAQLDEQPCARGYLLVPIRRTASPLASRCDAAADVLWRAASSTPDGGGAVSVLVAPAVTVSASSRTPQTDRCAFKVQASANNTCNCDTDTGSLEISVWAAETRRQACSGERSPRSRWQICLAPTNLQSV